VKAARCPTCKREAAPADNKFYPFCCERCQLVDLGRWLAEEYRIPEPPDASSREPSGDDES